MIEKPSTSCI